MKSKSICDLGNWRVSAFSIKRFFRNILAAETLALNEASEQVYYIRIAVFELPGFIDSILLPVNGIADNHFLFQSIYSTKTVDYNKILD